MKKVFQILGMAVLVLVAIGCSGKGASPVHLPQLDKLSPADMTAAKTAGLYGKVKTVTANNSVVEYNESGELSISNWTAENRYTIKYEDRTERFTVKYTNNSRHDIIVGTKDDCDCEGCQEYEFDNYGRIVKYYYSMGCMRDVVLYTYKGAEALPSSNCWENAEDGERIICLYEYRIIDAHGNWIERKTTEVTYSVYYDKQGKEVADEKSRKEPIIEKRTITYYE